VYFADDGGKSLFFVPVSFWFDSIRRLSSGVEHFHGKGVPLEKRADFPILTPFASEIKRLELVLEGTFPKVWGSGHKKIPSY
jgi:hypothetical protein